MSKEIRQKVNDCYKRMNAVLDPSTFGFQPNMLKIQDEINELQSKCKHHFVNGKCEYCDLEEK